MKIEINEAILIAVLKAYRWEQDWGDYRGELDMMCENIFANNKGLKEKVKI